MRTMREICSNLPMQTPKRCDIVNFEHNSHIYLMHPLLTWNKWMPGGMISSNPQQIGLPSLKNQHVASPLDTGRTLNVHEAFRRGPGSLLNVLYTFNLRLVLRRNIWWNVYKTFRRGPGSLLNVLCTFTLGPFLRRNIWWNVHKTFRKVPGSLLNVSCTYNLRPMLRRNTWWNVHKMFKRGPGSLLCTSYVRLIYVQCSGIIFGEWNLTL